MSNQNDSPTRPTRHILSLSGGKDSTALAIHMRRTRPHIEMDSMSSATLQRS